MSKLVFDLETIGENYDELDEKTQEVLTRWIKKESESEQEYQIQLEELKDGLGFSPLTGQICAIGVLDIDKNKGVVYYQHPGDAPKDFEENGVTFRAMSEKEMLEKFWEGARSYDEFVTFNGRAFDVPFLMATIDANRVR